MYLFMYYIEILDQENISIIPTTTVTTIMESTCTVNFETINNQPTINYQPMTTHNLSVNATFGTTTDSTTLTIILATTGGSILGFCTIFICITGIFVIKIKRNQEKPRRNVFTSHLLNSTPDRYVVIM